jgi:hypothetical protein
VAATFPSIPSVVLVSPPFIIVLCLIVVLFRQMTRLQSAELDYTDQMFEHTYPILTSIQDQATYSSDKAKSIICQDLKRLVRWLDRGQHLGFVELEVAGKELDVSFRDFAENVRNLAALFERVYEDDPQYIGHRSSGAQAFEQLALFLVKPSLASLKEFNQAAGTPALPRISSAEKSIISTLRKRSYVLDMFAVGASGVAAIVVYCLATYFLGIQKDFAFGGAIAIFTAFTTVYFLALRPRKETPSRHE